MQGAPVSARVGGLGSSLKDGCRSGTREARAARNRIHPDFAMIAPGQSHFLAGSSQHIGLQVRTEKGADMKPTKQIQHRIFLTAAALVITAVSVGEAPADTGTQSSGNVETTASTRAPSAGINLLSEPRTGQPAVRVRSMGSGSWICSPAGFGQRSRCYRN